MVKAPIKLFWWNGKPNFGDALSQLLVEYVSGRGVNWASERECDIFALGSIMKQVRRTHSRARDGAKPWIWGSGSVGSLRTDFLRNVRIASLRGPLTASLLGRDGVPLGDPGLLVAELFHGNLPKDKKHSVGLVLHHSQSATPEVAAFLEKSPNSKLINAASNDVLGVVSEIAECDQIVSSSLHGLVVADALNIPNIWLNPAGIHGTPRFKFYDYAASIKRSLDPPISFQSLSGMDIGEKEIDTSYFENLGTVSEEIKTAFPEDLT